MRRARGIVLAITVFAGSGAHFARAQPAAPGPRDPIAAEALFERGKTLIDQGHTEEACEAFAESERLDPAGGTLLRLAMCHESAGKLASAWLEFGEVIRESSEGPGDPAKLAERVRLAREHLAAVESRVPKLVVAVPPASRLSGLRVTVGGVERAEGSWGVPIPTDPGQVEVRAEAPGHLGFHANVHVAEGSSVLVIPPLDPVSEVHPAFASSSPVEGPSPLRPIAIAIGAAGVIALGVGTAFGLTAVSKWNDANSRCPQMACDATSVSLAQDAKQAATIADVTIGVGVVAVAAATILYFVGAPKPLRASATSIELAF